MRDNYSRDRNSRDKDDRADNHDRRTAPRQYRGLSKVAPKTAGPGEQSRDRADRRDSGRAGDDDREPTPATSAPSERDESGRDDTDSPARTQTPPAQKAGPEESAPSTPDTVGTPEQDDNQPGTRTPRNPQAELLDDELAAPGLSDEDDDRVDQAVDDVLRDNGFKPYSGYGGEQGDFGFSIYTGWGPGLEEVVRSGDLGERSTGDPELDKIVIEHLRRHAAQIAAAGGGKGGWGPLILEGFNPDPNQNGIPGGAVPNIPR